MTPQQKMGFYLSALTVFIIGVIMLGFGIYLSEMTLLWMGCFWTPSGALWFLILRRTFSRR